MSDCAPEITIGPFVVGERPAPLVYQFQDANGAPLNLSAGYTAKFTYREVNATSSTEAAATMADAPNGKVQYVWTGIEFPTPGKYVAEFWTGNGTNRFASSLIVFRVRKPVGNVPAI